MNCDFNCEMTLWQEEILLLLWRHIDGYQWALDEIIEKFQKSFYDNITQEEVMKMVDNTKKGRDVNYSLALPPHSREEGVKYPVTGASAKEMVLFLENRMDYSRKYGLNPELMGWMKARYRMYREMMLNDPRNQQMVVNQRAEKKRRAKAKRQVEKKPPTPFEHRQVLMKQLKGIAEQLGRCGKMNGEKAREMFYRSLLRPSLHHFNNGEPHLVADILTEKLRQHREATGMMLDGYFADVFFYLTSLREELTA